MTFLAPLRLAIDIGGTFTDTVLVDAADAVIASTKTLTTHDNPAEGALLGATRALTDATASMTDITGFIHGTTLATNALIEKRGARVATITTEGFRDILEIGYERRYSQYDINLQKTDFLVPRDRALTVRERMSASGEVLIVLDEASIADLIAKLDDCKAEAVAICLMHAYANPAHEQRLRHLLQDVRPDLRISISSEVSPEAREFDRLCTTVANAYIQPLMARYLDAFASVFKSKGLRCQILMMTAGGGMTTLHTAGQFPIRLVESGPAGGAILAARIARENDLGAVLSFDMGGTTAKLCLIDDATPQTSRQFEIGRAVRFIKGSGMPVRIPVIDMIEIGAGGGSIAAVDRLGRLTVGPKSAGSEPGPVAFGRGGSDPTVTDADVVLGYIQAENFAEGQFAIETAAAEEVLLTTLGMPLGLDACGAADGVSRIVDESMASAARTHAVESGKVLSQRTMIAFGGNGPLHACRVARSAGVRRVLIPTNPSVGSALGFLFAPVSFEIVRSRYALLAEMDIAAINRLLGDMCREALAVVRQGDAEAPVTTRRSAYMRYHGQGHEIEIALPDRAISAEDLKSLTAAFETAYSAQFSRPVPGMNIETLNWSVHLSTPMRPLSEITAQPRLRHIQPTRTKRIFCDVSGVFREAAFVPREVLRPGDHLSGPALIAEPQTTTFVGADFTLDVDMRGTLILTRETQSD
ncbi:hydantoinase/oxoprolinase family protein [uncultured Roseobacter sp.]|uniref:hydantoinase/oxoprolinase family protein n=1 Tax=uncultured Roseobacter sp. TaxID=114847 RepID=UPI0026294872|nr:hydantoinase/oxoprolinase family protein [uncultured Roseobacter sp.]